MDVPVGFVTIPLSSDSQDSTLRAPEWWDVQGYTSPNAQAGAGDSGVSQVAAAGAVEGFDRASSATPQILVGVSVQVNEIKKTRYLLVALTLFWGSALSARICLECCVLVVPTLTRRTFENRSRFGNQTRCPVLYDTFSLSECARRRGYPGEREGGGGGSISTATFVASGVLHICRSVHLNLKAINFSCFTKVAEARGGKVRG